MTCCDSLEEHRESVRGFAMLIVNIFMTRQLFDLDENVGSRACILLSIKIYFLCDSGDFAAIELRSFLTISLINVQASQLITKSLRFYIICSKEFVHFNIDSYYGLDWECL